MNYSLIIFRCCLVLLFSVCVLVSGAQAEGTIVAQVEIDTTIEPASSVGLLISSHGTLQKKISKIEKSNHGTSIAFFEVDAAEIFPDTLAGALLTAKNGGMVLGNLRAISAEPKLNFNLKLPLCSDDKKRSFIRSEQFGVLQTLIKYRADRRNLTRGEVSRVMNGKFLTRLNEIEEALGLARSNVLSPDLNPTELIDRLSRLTTAFRAYKSRPKPVVQEQPTNEDKDASESESSTENAPE